MKALKHFSILILALCLSYFTDAQSVCSAVFTYQTTGTNVVVKITHPYLTSTYSWKLDGTRVGGIAIADSVYTITGVYAGTHTICAYVYVPNGSQICDSSCQTITTTSCGTLTAQWTDNVGTNDTVNYYAYDTNSIAHHFWNYGDGSNYGTTTAATHVYSAPGTYHVCFYTYFPGTLCNDSLCESVVVPSATHCTAAFTDSVNGSTISVNATANPGSGNNYAWYIDGQLAASPNPNTSFTFNNVLPGTHRICLWDYINNTFLCDSICKNVTLTSCGTLTAQWTDNIGTNDTVRFTAYDTNSVAHHIFNFGDNTYSTSGTSVTHVYTAPGTYHVCLYSYIPNTSCSDSLCESVVVPNSNPCGTLTAYWNSPTPTNDTLKATAYDTNSVAHHIWNFGDGTTGSGTNGTHVYTSAGTYNVCFYAYFPGTACNDSFCRSVVIPSTNHCGVASYYSYVIGDSSLLLYSNSTNTDSTDYFVWYVYNSAGALVQSQSGHTTRFQSHGLPVGTYKACLYLYNPNQLLCDSFCNYIAIINCSSLNAQWTYTNYANVGGDSVKYNAPSNNPTNSTYAWTFGDGSTSTSPSVTHTYTQSGTYTVCLVVSNPAVTCKDTLCQSITVGNACGTLTAYWNSPTPTNDTLRATAYDTISTAHHFWNFGDGTTGSGTSVTHVYSTAGTYHVCFYSYIPGTVCSDSFCRSVVIPSTGCGVASFSDYIYGDTSIHAFSTSTGTGNNTLYTWTIKGINGGVIQSQSGSTNYIISHHLQAGSYVVCLTLYNGTVLCDSTCSTIVVPLIGACGTPGFRDSVTSSIGGGIIHAYTTSTSVDSVAQYIWKIWGAHGLVQTFTGVNDFTSATLDTGTYTVCQYIRATGVTYICDSLCQTVTIGSTNPCSGLTAVWTHTLQSNTTDSVEFHSSANPAGTTYTWSFGDGHFSTDPNVTHGYAQAGTYTACLTVTIPGTNCTDSSCQSIVISTTTPCPVAGLNGYVYQDSSIHLISTSTGVTVHTVYYWVVTNAAGTVVQTANGQGTSTTLLTGALPNGTYTVCLLVYASANTYCDSACMSFTINNNTNPCAGLNANFTTTHLNNGNVQFIPTDTATGVTHYWHFGDGTVSTNNDPVHAYTTSGLYHVCQYVYYAGSTCVDSFCTNVQANASGCNASFTAQGYYPPYNGVHFTNTSTSTDSIISYRWTFGDSTVATFASGNHTFPHSGKWLVCLYIYSQHGCSSSYCDSVNVSYDPCYGLSSAYTYSYGQNGGVHFVGSTNITNVTNYWTFGDGTSATTFDPTHYYTQPGTYTVCHIVSINGTLCSDTTCQSVQGTGVGNSCNANFSDSAVLNTNTIFFNNYSTSSDSIVSYVWNFGDGSSSTSVNTHHTYSNSGTYYACLTITAANGCTSTHCDSVHVGHVSTACHASFTYTVDSCQVITFTSTSTGSLEFLRWIYGDGTTDTLSHPTHTYAQGGYYTVILHFYGNNCYNFDTAVIYVPSCSSHGDTVCGLVFNDVNGNGVQNSNEPGIANAEVHIGNYVAHTDSTGHYVIVVPAGTYTIYYCTTTGYTFSIPVNNPYNANTNCAAYQSVVVTNGSNCGYNFGILNNSATICGTVYFDANDNHSQDQNESGIPNARVVFTSGGQVVYTAYTDQYGHYCAVLPAGTYVITAGSSLYTGGVVTPASITVTAAAGGSYQNNNFGIYVQPGACDLSINVTPNTTITPGYAAWYQIQVCNVGPVVTSGVVNLFYDPSLKYNYASPAPASQNSSTFTASWNLDNLNPGSCQYYYVSLTADSTIIPGQFIFTLASVNTTGCTDANQNNNVDTVHQNATASWDPNNKQVSPAGIGPEGGIDGNQWLTYTINFQNTGTAPAVNIVVQDTLSANLDVSTFKMLGASLPYTMQFAGNEVIWKFNSVMLPDSAVDQQGSHGFVSFMILPLQGLPGKTQITNSADIFFDYNAGVKTNQTLNTIDYTLSVAQIAADNVTITLQPNPFNQFTTIKIDGAEGPYQLNVYDMLGRAVKAQSATGNTFNVDRGGLASGMYMYEIIEQGKVIGKGKMIAQ